MVEKGNVKGIIFDIDGTLILNQKALPNAIETISILRKTGMQLRFVTNTTVRTSEQISVQLADLGFDILSHEIMTSVTACLTLIQKKYLNQAGFLAIPNDLKVQFSAIQQTQENPAYVVLGDLDEAFDYEILNRIFNFMRNGAQLVTFHRNPYFFRDGKTWLDSGAFTQALEIASGQKAIVTGKPAAELFENAISSMGLQKSEVIVVGDDVLTDIQGANNVGLISYLVETGKFKPEHLHEYKIDESRYIQNIKDILKICEL